MNNLININRKYIVAIILIGIVLVGSKAKASKYEDPMNPEAPMTEEKEIMKDPMNPEAPMTEEKEIMRDPMNPEVPMTEEKEIMLMIDELNNNDRYINKESANIILNKVFSEDYKKIELSEDSKTERVKSSDLNMKLSKILNITYGEFIKKYESDTYNPYERVTVSEFKLKLERILN